MEILRRLLSVQFGPVRSDWTGLAWTGLIGPSVLTGLNWLAGRYRRLGLARNLQSKPGQAKTKPVQSSRTDFGLARKISDLKPLKPTSFRATRGALPSLK